MTSTELGLELKALTRTFGRSGQTIGPVSFGVRPGECFGLVGANGAGKTTLMRQIVGLDAPTSGTIHVLGSPVVPFRPTPGVTGMIEEPTFFSWLGAADNLRAAFPHRRLGRAELDDMLAQVGLAEVGDKKVVAFSQGMRQRLGIARALLARPAVLVLDEPTNGLDPVGIRWLRDVIARQRDLGVAIILSSHMLHEVQASAQSFLMLDHGRPITGGRVADIAGVHGLEELYFAAIGSG